MADRAQGGGTATVPLCVDLDGTLLRSDLLVESVLALLRRNPLYLFALPFWLLRGKARLKRQVSSRVRLDASTLPYDERVLAVLRDARGRRRVLCTASDELLAAPVAAHLGLFDEVIASDGRHNANGAGKASRLVERFGRGGFDYMGNATVDLAVWRDARAAWVANAPARLATAAAAIAPVAGVIPAERAGLRDWLQAARLHQWLKNLLVFVPLLASHRFLEPAATLDALLAFLAFGLCASGVYLLNDLVDLPADRRHPRKRSRPFAAGRLPLVQGLVAAPLLSLAGLVLAWNVAPAFAGVLALYYATTLAYSFALKRVVMLDVVVLAGLYTVRIIGGAVAIGSGLSFWLLAFSMFIFLSLAMLKRYIELGLLLSNGEQRSSGRGYTVEDLPLIQSLGGASGYLAVLVLALYISSPESLALYSRPQWLWLLCPLLLYWVSRAWVIAHRGTMHDDPVVFAATDRTSQAIALLGGVVALCAI